MLMVLPVKNSATDCARAEEGAARVAAASAVADTKNAAAREVRERRRRVSMPVVLVDRLDDIAMPISPPMGDNVSGVTTPDGAGPGNAAHAVAARYWTWAWRATPKVQRAVQPSEGPDSRWTQVFLASRATLRKNTG